MQITFKELILHNFMSFENAALNLDDNGYVMVSGVNNNPDDNAKSNGSGKSSIWEGISWALTGNTLRGTKDVQRYGSDTCSVELTFIVDSKEYKIKRTKSPSNLFIYVDGADKSGKGIRDTEKILSDMFPDITEGLINSVIILGQGLPQRFTNNTPAGRKDVLEKLSQSDYMITDLKTRVEARYTKVNKDLRDNENNAIALETSLKNNNSYLTAYKNKLEELDSYNIDDLQAKLDKCIESRTSWEKQLEQLNKDLKEQELEYNNINNKLLSNMESYNKDKSDIDDKFSDELIELNTTNITLNSEIKQLENEIKRLESIKDICPTCGQKLPGVLKPDTTEQHQKVEEGKKRLSEVISKMQSLNNEKAELIKELDTRTFSIKKQLNDDKTACSDKLNFIKRNIQNTNLSISSSAFTEAQFRNTINNYYTDIESINSSIKETEKSVKEIEDKQLYNNLEHDKLKSHIDVLNKFNTALKRDFRGYLLQNVINYIDQCSKEYCQVLFDTNKISFSLDGNNISISYNGKEYENLSGGEKQKIDLCIQFSLRDMLSQFLDFSCNILVLDEITDNLDEIGCQRVIDLISDKLDDVKSIYIISHRSDLSIPSDKELIIEKDTEGISKCVMI